MASSNGVVPMNESTNETVIAPSEATAPFQKDAEDTSKDNSAAMDPNSIVALDTDAKPSELTPAVGVATVTETLSSEAAAIPPQKDTDVTSNENSGTVGTNPIVGIETDAKAEASKTAPAVTSESNTKPAGIIVHHLNNSRSQRILWLLEELEIPYEIKKHERTAEGRAPDTLKTVHPLGKSPAITDGAMTLAESGAITAYLLEKYGGAKFRPTEDGKIDDLYFTHYAEGSLMPVVVNKFVFSLIPRRSPALIRPLVKFIFSNIEKQMLMPQLKAHCELIESHLKKSKTGWFAGGDHPTCADFMMVFGAEALAAISGDLPGSKTKEYLKRVHERPAYKRGLEKGGKYDFV